MKSVLRLFFTCALLIGVFTAPAFAGATDPLFINLTTDDSHRALMGIGFGKAQLERGHPLSIFINDKAVLVASKANSEKYTEQQKELSEILKNGGVVLICPMCMKKFGIKESDLLNGIKIGNPKLTGDALFRNNTKTMAW
jgi:predicted peroxiredoxin